MSLDNELTLAHKLADIAGDIIRRHWQSTLTVETKADDSPVTIADREVEEALRKGIEEAFPTHGIFGEEFGALREDSPWQWVLDPIDGTRAFIAKQPTFTTLIALAKDGVPMLGVIDQAITRERWIGIPSRPSSLNGNVIETSRIKLLTEASISTTSTDYFKPEEALVYEKLRAQCAKSYLGADAYAYAKLADGKQDLVVDAGMKPYDFCALKPVIEHAGGVITDWEGNPITTASNGRVLAAATKDLHKQALTILQAGA